MSYSTFGEKSRQTDSIVRAEAGKKTQQEKQTKALAPRSCSVDNDEKGKVINAVVDFDNTLHVPETNDGNS